MTLAKFVRIPYLQNTTRRLLLIVAVSIALLMKEELASETENYDTKTMYQFEPKWNLLRSTLQVKQQVSELVKKYTPGETTGFRSSRLYVFKTFVNSTGKHLCLSLLASNSIKKRLQCSYS